MANDTRLNIVVDNSQAIPAIEETGKAVEDLKNKSKGSTKETKKDWGGVADLFSSVLPRSLTKSIRSFKSTGRQVGRLSRSFKFLKTSRATVIWNFENQRVIFIKVFKVRYFLKFRNLVIKWLFHKSL